MDKKLSEVVKFVPAVGQNALTASKESMQLSVGEYTADVDALLASLAGSSPEIEAARNQFGAAIAEPIMQIIPYVEQYGRFFQQQTIGDLEDNLIGVEDLTNVAYSSHPRAEILFNEPGYRFVRPTFSTFQTGFKIAWPTLRKAGWNIVARQMNYVAWELARKRDAAAKVVLDAAIPTSHKLTVTGGLTKAAVDQVVRQSNQIGFPVKYAVINPGRLMEMQSWTWGGTGFYLPPEVAKQLVDNLYYGNYAGIQWFANPYAPVNTVYFGGDASQIGWHQMKGSPRTDSFSDMVQGEDLYSFRDAEHSWYIQSGLTLWQIAIA